VAAKTSPAPRGTSSGSGRGFAVPLTCDEGLDLLTEHLLREQEVRVSVRVVGPTSQHSPRRAFGSLPSIDKELPLEKDLSHRLAQ
jgi:hypothetical protein